MHIESVQRLEGVHLWFTQIDIQAEVCHSGPTLEGSVAVGESARTELEYTCPPSPTLGKEGFQ